LVFEGESPAVKDLGGTLVKNMSEIEVSALPQDLPHEIKVSLESLKTFEDRILVKDLVLPNNVKATANPEEIVALVAAQENVEEEWLQRLKKMLRMSKR
jgi:large subunit ribosomal protein L25